MNLDEARVGLALAGRDGGAGSPYAPRALRELIREAARQGGLGKRDPDVPFADIIEPGMSVLLKPNWVLHYNQSGHSMDCMVTHPRFILAALEEVIAAKPGRVVIADAPIQSADFAALTPVEWRAEVDRICGGVPCAVLDLRNRISTWNNGIVSAAGDLRDPSRFVLFDLGKDSLLEPVSVPEGRFRVANYDPRRMAMSHHPGRHRFLLCKEPFEADVILNLPKLKAHAKTGLTAALKNLVGLNGDKDYLPHHRAGGSALGGDCYEGLKPFKRVAELLLDGANRRIGRSGYTVLHRAATLVNAVHRGPLDGRWSGNDTTWRMVLDLNRILVYGRTDATMSSTPLRTIYSLTDGIVAGQRNGPLAPEPVQLGAVTFGSNSTFVDLAHAALMHFDATRIGLLEHALSPMKYPLTTRDASEVRVWNRGAELTLAEAGSQHGLDFVPPDRWMEIARAGSAARPSPRVTAPA